LLFVFADARADVREDAKRERDRREETTVRAITSLPFCWLIQNGWSESLDERYPGKTLRQYITGDIPVKMILAQGDPAPS